MRALLHCGTFKTGSTAIQNTAWLNQSTLLENGVLYPTAGIDSRAAKDDGEIGYRHSRFVYEYGNASLSKLLRQLDNEIRNTDGHTLFMSAEPWSSPKAAAALNATVEHLAKRGFKEIRGLVFIRNARDYMVRHYREWVRRHGVKQPFAPYVLSRKHFFDYLTICRNIKTVFKGQVDFVDYSKVADVNEYTFNKLDLNYKALAAPQKTNNGISCLDTEVHRILNEYGLRLPGIPNSANLLARFGLQEKPHVFTEKLPSGFLEIYGKDYIRDFSKLSGIDHADCKALFSSPYQEDIDVSTVSPILEKTLMEWLKDSRRQTP